MKKGNITEDHCGNRQLESPLLSAFRLTNAARVLYDRSEALLDPSTILLVVPRWRFHRAAPDSLHVVGLAGPKSQELLLTLL